METASVSPPLVAAVCDTAAAEASTVCEWKVGEWVQPKYRSWRR